MVSGDIDLGQLTGPPGVAANLRGADILYVAMTDDRWVISWLRVRRSKAPVI